MTIERAFVRIKEGQAHYLRTMEPIGGRPLVTLHMSPVASNFLIPLLTTLDDGSQRLIAPDTLGNGDSCSLVAEKPEIADLAEGLSRVLDALGVDDIDLYGVRTGSMIATELALLQPDRVKHLILDELTVPGPARSTGSIGDPCPPPDAIGSQINWAFHVMKDHWSFYPWWQRDAEHRNPWSLPDPMELHEETVAVLKAVRTFGKPYNAAMRWPRDDRLPLLKVPTMVLHEPTGKIYPDMRPTAKVIPSGVFRDLPPGDTTQPAKARTIAAWLKEG
ncbi:MAG: alpha/beta hydrolase [Proteobacteria bacterium]|nr:alpha/beta hydrolase [Pseudomonadota bacterium]MDA1058413.1 alpha/beta hydrolase [Pseudomonadota bacterium]